MASLMRIVCNHCDKEWTDRIFMELEECPYCGMTGDLLIEKVKETVISKKKRKKKHDKQR